MWPILETGAVEHTHHSVLKFLATLDWVSIASFFVAVASFVIARATLKEAKEDWKQRKWFDLYFSTDEAYNALDRYQTLYTGQPYVQTPQQVYDWNKLMFLI